MRAMHNEIRFDMIRKNIGILFAHDYLLELVPNRQQVNVPLHIAHTLHNNVKTPPIKSTKSNIKLSRKNEEKDESLNQISDEIHELIIGEIAVPLLMLRRDVTKQLYQQLYTNITNKSEP